MDRKTSQLGGYSTRHIRRIVDKRLQEDLRELRSLVSSDASVASHSGTGSVNVSNVESTPSSPNCDEMSEHSYTDEQFLYSEVSSKCSLSEDEPLSHQDESTEAGY